jgi:hypothetical protein
LHDLGHGLEIADIRIVAADKGVQSGGGEQARLFGRKRNALNFGTEPAKPKTEPSSLKTRVAEDDDAFAGPEAG